MHVLFFGRVFVLLPEKYCLSCPAFVALTCMYSSAKWPSCYCYLFITLQGYSCFISWQGFPVPAPSLSRAFTVFLPGFPAPAPDAYYKSNLNTASSSRRLHDNKLLNDK